MIETVNGFLVFRSEEAHRYGTTDMEWANAQQKGKPKYVVGDVVEFELGGVGVIITVNYRKDSGWPPSYSIKNMKGKPYHPRNKQAWHYEGDFTMLHESASRRL